MYCTKCGKELKSTARFCPQCGAAVGQKETGQSASMVSMDSPEKEYQESSVQQSTQTHTERTRKSGPKKAMVVIGIILFLAIGAGILLFWYNSPQNRLQRQLDLAQRYLLEEEYEQAIVEFEKAIALDPKCVEAYLGAAEAYVALEDYESAVELLEAGYEETEDESLQQELERYLEEVVYLLVKEQSFNSDGSVRGWDEYEYDNRGNQIKYTWYNADGSVLSWYEYEYDNQENQIKATEYNADGSVNYWDEYKYDNRGNQIKYTWYNADGSVITWFEYGYEYDSQGNLIKKTNYDADGSVIGWDEYEYDVQGNQIKYTVYYADGSVYYWDEYEYDVQGNQIKYTWYNADGSVQYWHEYEYDNQGNRIKDTIYYADGSVYYWVEYEYDIQGSNPEEEYRTNEMAMENPHELVDNSEEAVTVKGRIEYIIVQPLQDVDIVAEAYALILNPPIQRIICKNAYDDICEIENVDRLELWGEIDFEPFEGKDVLLTGNIWENFNAWHIADMSMDVEKVQLVDTESIIQN